MPENPTWWQRGVFYQVYPWSFADASGDGIGDLAGIRNHVDYLEWLGVDCVWLSPIYPSPGADLGYDISDYRGIDSRFGALSDFDAMLDALHASGIRLVLDLVPNHTSDRHPWFLASRSTSADPRHDWYVWRDPRPDGGPPNNWQSYFGGPAWTYLEPPGRWYLHSFDRAQPDLNWDNPDVRTAIADVIRFWLDRGVDGFRVDVLWLLGKDPEFRDNPPNPEWREGLPEWLRFIRAHSEDGPSAHEYARILRSVIDEYPDRVMIGEVVLPPRRAVNYYGEELSEAHLPHNFALTELREWSADSVRRVVEDYEAVLPQRAWPNWLLGDHDFPRILARVGANRGRLVQMLLLTLRGTPTCYYGDELGMTNARFGNSPIRVADPQATTGVERDRLVARTPMQWTNEDGAGFSSAEPWLPVASNDPELTVERQRTDPDSLLNLFRSLLRLRKALPSLAVGAYRSLPAPEGVFSFERWHRAGSVRVHLNFGSSTREIELGESSTVLLSTNQSTLEGEEARSLSLESGEGVIVGR